MKSRNEWKETRIEFGSKSTELHVIRFLLKNRGWHFVLSVSIHFPLYWIGKWITAATKSIYAWHACSCLLILNSLYCSQQKPTRVPQLEEWLRKRNRRIVSKNDGDYLNLQPKKKKVRKRTRTMILWLEKQCFYMSDIWHSPVYHPK